MYAVWNSQLSTLRQTENLKNVAEFTPSAWLTEYSEFKFRLSKLHRVTASKFVNQIFFRLFVCFCLFLLHHYKLVHIALISHSHTARQSVTN